MTQSMPRGRRNVWRVNYSKESEDEADLVLPRGRSARKLDMYKPSDDEPEPGPTAQKPRLDEATLRKHAERMMRSIFASRNLFYTPEKKVEDLFGLRTGPYYVEIRPTPACVNAFKTADDKCVSDRPGDCHNLHFRAMAYFTTVVGRMDLTGEQKMRQLFGPNGCFAWSLGTGRAYKELAAKNNKERDGSALGGGGRKKRKQTKKRSSRKKSSRKKKKSKKRVKKRGR